MVDGVAICDQFSLMPCLSLLPLFRVLNKTSAKSFGLLDKRTVKRLEGICANGNGKMKRIREIETRRMPLQNLQNSFGIGSSHVFAALRACHELTVSFFTCG